MTSFTFLLNLSRVPRDMFLTSNLATFQTPFAFFNQQNLTSIKKLTALELKSQ